VQEEREKKTQSIDLFFYVLHHHDENEEKEMCVCVCGTREFLPPPQPSARAREGKQM
jgi:hypothetical protein